MSLTTIVFIVILLFFTWRGYQKGFIGAISRVLSFLIAYPAAIFFTKPFANFLRGFIALDGLLLFLVAGCTIFLTVSLAVTLLLSAIARLIPQTQVTETSSKIGGTLFGVVIGSVFGLIAVYVIDILVKPKTQIANYTSAQTETGPATREADEEAIKKYVMEEGRPSVKTSQDTFIDTAAKQLVSNAASTAVALITDDKATSQITKTITQDPQSTLNHVQNMTNDGEFKALLNKPSFQAELNRGNVDLLLQNKDFRDLMQNPDMKAIISADDNELATDKSGERAAAVKMIQAWQKVSTLKNDPRVLEIVRDEAFQAQLNSPNKLALLMNPKMRELTEIIFSSGSGGGSASAPITDSELATEKERVHYTIEDITNGPAQESNEVQSENSPKEKESSEQSSEQKLYRWTDENGKVHFSDKPIKDKP